MQPSAGRRVLNRALGLLPAPFRVRALETAHAFSHPTVGKGPALKELNGVRLEPWKFGARAAVCISADFELAWASQYVSLELCLDEGRRTREFFPGLLDAFNRNHVPITWAVVGHLFLTECRRDPATGLAHSELPHPRPYRNWRWGFKHGDWYQHDPRSSVEDDPEWYAPDLIARIASSDVQHEIGSHSFSHTDFSDANCPAEVARAELRRCQEEAARIRRDLKSFVFPGNFEGNFPALFESGFVAFRGTGTPDLSYPEKRDGLWNIRESLQLFDPEVDYRRRLPLYVNAAVRTQTACHLSFHPSEPSPSTVAEVLRPALGYLKSRENNGEAWMATMGEVASYCEARASTVVQPDADMHWGVKWGHDAQRYPRSAITFSVPWTGSTPSCEIDGQEVAAQSRSCFVRSDRLYLSVEYPKESVRVRRS